MIFLIKHFRNLFKIICYCIILLLSIKYIFFNEIPLSLIAIVMWFCLLPLLFLCRKYIFLANDRHVGTQGIRFKDGTASFAAEKRSCLFVSRVPTAVADINSILFHPTHPCIVVVISPLIVGHYQISLKSRLEEAHVHFIHKRELIWIFDSKTL